MHRAGLFNVAQFREKTNTARTLIRGLLFADAHSAEEMHKIMDAFSDASKTFCLKLNIKKTEVLYIPNSTRTREEDIMIDGNKLNYVLEFTSLSADYARSSGTTTMYPRQDIPCNRAVHPPMWSRGLDSIQSTRKNDACLHGATYVFMKITWMDKVTNKEILERTGLSFMKYLIITNILWTGNLMGMLPDRLPKKVFYSQLSSGPSSPVLMKIRLTA